MADSIMTNFRNSDDIVKRVMEGVDVPITVTSSQTRDTVSGTCKRFGMWEHITLNVKRYYGGGTSTITISGLTPSNTNGDASVGKGTVKYIFISGDSRIAIISDEEDISTTSYSFKISDNNDSLVFKMARLIL